MPTPVADNYTAPSGTTLYAGLFPSSAPDTTPPLLTGSITIGNLTSSSYSFTAPVGSDNVAVTRYRWRVNGGVWVVIAGGGRSGSISGRTPGSTDTLEMAAGDAAGNWSLSLSRSVTLGTQASPWSGVSELLQTIDEDSWIRINSNAFSDAFPPQSFQPLAGPNTISYPAMVVPWASVALDDARGRIFIWGGGHANSNDNSLFTWDAPTRAYSQAFLSTDNVFSPTARSLYTSSLGLWRNVEDWQHSPPSAHTYGNNAFLPILNRFITFGGAAWNTGHAFHVTTSDGSEVRPLSSYTLDMSQAYQGKVAGTTGSNVKRGDTAGVSLDGANAWAPRDYGLDHPLAGTAAVNNLNGHLEGFTAYRQENGHDVLYVRCSMQVGGTSDRLVRIEYLDNDYHHDLISVVGIPVGSDAYSDQGGAIDPERGIVVNCGYSTAPISFWNLATASPGNGCITPAFANIGGNGKASYVAAMNAHHDVRPQSYGMGMCFDTERNRFVMWGGLRQVWVAPTPADLLLGWAINELPVGGTDSPVYGNETGVHGKFKYSERMDCYLAVNSSSAEIWAYKPRGWNPKL